MWGKLSHLFVWILFLTILDFFNLVTVSIKKFHSIVMKNITI